MRKVKLPRLSLQISQTTKVYDFPALQFPHQHNGDPCPHHFRIINKKGFIVMKCLNSPISNHTYKTKGQLNFPPLGIRCRQRVAP